MTAQTHETGELYPRPERDPDAIRAALAAVDPARLEEMQRNKDETFAVMAQDGLIGHVQLWMDFWLREVEIERRPELAARRNAALAELGKSTGQDDPVFRRAMDEIRAVEAVAEKAIAS